MFQSRKKYDTYLTTKLVAWESKNTKAFTLSKLGVELHKLSVIGLRKTSFRRNVDDYAHMAPAIHQLLK